MLPKILITFCVTLHSLVNVYSLHPNKKDTFDYKHHSNDEIEYVLQNIKQDCPEITSLFNLSTRTILGRKIHGIVFGRVSDAHTPLTPEVKIVGGIHGNEKPGIEVPLRLAYYLCEAYNNNDVEVRRLLHMTRVHIIPSINPDGSEIARDNYLKNKINSSGPSGRTNNNSIDLNRSYPKLDKIWFANQEQAAWNNHHLWHSSKQEMQLLEPETQGMIKWMQSIPFVLSGAFHSGDLVINYPFDSPMSSKTGVASLTPDESVFQEIAYAYANKHANMVGSKCYPDEPGFPTGITNGAEWYSLRGGMEDFNYLGTNCFEVIMEIACNNFPNITELPQLWKDNKNAVMNYMWQAHLGIKGIVYDEQTGRGIPDAEIQVTHRTKYSSAPIWHFVTSAAQGDYYRLLVDGDYKITASKVGYIAKTSNVRVRNQPYKGAKKIDFALTPAYETVN